MKLRRAIKRRLRHESEGIDVAGDVNAVIAANVNEPGPTHTRVSSKQRVVQRSGRRQTEREPDGDVPDGR